MTKLTNFIFRSSLAIAIIFNIVAVDRAKAEDVNDFAGLQGAIGNNSKNYINVKQNILFGNMISIERGNLTISGSGGNKVNLDGSNNSRLLRIRENFQDIRLENLHFTRGNTPDPNEPGGAAIYLDGKTKITLKNVSFSNNIAENNEQIQEDDSIILYAGGGALCSQGEKGNQNILAFIGDTIFNGNKSTKNRGGAIYALLSELTFSGGRAEFTGNKSFAYGGAIYAENNTAITFSEETIFSANENTGNGFGGAIGIFDNSKFTFQKDVTFSKNVSLSQGGAINSAGDTSDFGKSRNTLLFKGNSTFDGNKVERTGDSSIFGGAINAINSDLTFGGEVVFKENSSLFSGGTAAGNNQASGGAITIIQSSLTFEKLAIFEKNSSDWGGALFICESVSIKFNNGLRLIENTTGNTNSGALHMQGNSNGELAIITIIQKNPLVPTEFRGNTSEDGGHNAV
ncbi:MAG: hypothetical protein LBB13_00750, partial [Rickettsiales bacterium]|nr:hypothetical protein [Rickettsiales bacterium]